MTTAYTSLLGLALPVTGELSGTWGDVVNQQITGLLDSAIAGTTTLSTDGDVILTTTDGASNQARQAILLCSGARTAARNITAPAHSKIYTVINATTGGYAVTIRGSGPTTGVSIPAGQTAQVAWNGSDFVDAGNYFNGNLKVNGNLSVTGTSTLTGAITSNLIFTDNTYDIGASGATRPRSLFLAGAATIGGNTTINGGALILGSGNNDIRTSTSDGADSSSVRISGGGAISVDRGAMLQAFGNEHLSFPGHVYVDQGNVTSAYTYFRYGSNVVGAQMDNAGNWTFNKAVGINSTPNDSQARLIVTSTVGSAAIRARNPNDTGYRSDWAVDAAGTTSINSYYDTTLAYKPLRIDATELRFSPSGSNSDLRAYFDGSGLRVSSSGSFSSSIAENLIAAQMALMSANTVKTVFRITDTGNADMNIRLRSGASTGVASGTGELQTNAYNMWLSTANATGALKITDTVNNGNNGQVTKPYNACFSAGLSSSGGSQAVTANAALVFSNEFVDAGANYNTGNGRFTAPVTGSYWINAHARWDNTNAANAYFSMVIYVNGTQVQRSLGDLIYMPASNYSYSTIGIVLALSAGDYVQAGTRQNTGTTFDTIPTECSFDGFLIG